MNNKIVGLFFLIAAGNSLASGGLRPSFKSPSGRPLISKVCFEACHDCRMEGWPTIMTQTVCGGQYRCPFHLPAAVEKESLKRLDEVIRIMALPKNHKDQKNLRMYTSGPCGEKAREYISRQLAAKAAASSGGGTGAAAGAGAGTGGKSETGAAAGAGKKGTGKKKKK